jgi:hypothetical protein
MASRVQQVLPTWISGNAQVLVVPPPQVPSLLTSSRGQQVPPACCTVPAGHRGVGHTPLRGLLPSGQVCDWPQVPVAMASGVQHLSNCLTSPSGQGSGLPRFGGSICTSGATQMPSLFTDMPGGHDLTSGFGTMQLQPDPPRAEGTKSLSSTDA